MGDSLIVIRAGTMLKVHIHTDEPEDVFDYLRSFGTLATHKAEDMAKQHELAQSTAADGTIRRPVALFTDSVGDLPEEVIRAHGIHVTPLLLIQGDNILRDGVDITAEEFHAMMEAADDTLPTTSQPSPADFIRTYEAAAQEGEVLLGVTAGSALTGTHHSAEAASKVFEEAQIHLVDSCGASLLQGLLTLKAAELAEAGMPPAEIVQELQRIRKRSNILFTVETFDRLLASGRVGKGRALLGSMLNVKPILGLEPGGTVIPMGKALGRKRVTAQLLEVIRTEVGDARKVRFGVVHVGCPDTAREVRETLKAEYGDVEILVAPATPVVATHLGPGAWGVAFMVED